MSGPKEFDCFECGQHIVDCSGTNTSNLCATCICIPGWFTDADLRAIFGPSHDGIEAMERQS